MEKIFADPTFQQQPLGVRRRVLHNYFRQHIASDPQFKQLPIDKQEKVYANFMQANLWRRDGSTENISDNNADKVVIDVAKSIPSLREQLIQKAEQVALQDQQQEPKNDIMVAIEKALHPKPGQFEQSAKEHWDMMTGKVKEPDEIAAIAERANFDYSQFVDLAKAYMQQLKNGKVDPKLELELEKQREKTLKSMVEALDKEGYDLLKEGDKLVAVDRNTGKKYNIDENFVKNIANQLKTSRYEIMDATGGAIAGARIGSSFGPVGAVVGGLIGSALGAALGAADDYYLANKHIGKDVDAGDVAKQALSAGVADFVFGVLAAGVGKSAGKAVSKAYDVKDTVKSKIASAIERPALKQLYKDLDVDRRTAHEWYKEFLQFYDIHPKTEQEVRRLKALAVALHHPQAAPILEQAIKDDPKAAIQISKEISLRADNLLKYAKKGASQEVVAKYVDEFGKEAGKKYSEAEEVLKAALNREYVDIDQLGIDDVLENVRRHAGDPNIESKIESLKNTINDIIQTNGRNASSLAEVRKQLNDFYRRNKRALTYKPDKDAILRILNNIDNIIESKLKNAGYGDDVLKMYRDAVDTYKTYAKARDTKIYNTIKSEGKAQDELSTAYYKAGKAVDDTMIKFLKPLSPAKREKAELGLIKSAIDKHLTDVKGARAIDWNGLSKDLQSMKKVFKSKTSRQILDLVDKLDDFYAKDQILQAVASRTTTKAPATIAQTLSGKLEQTWNKLRFEFLLKNLPFTEFNRRLKYQEMIQDAIKQEKPLKEFAIELTKDSDPVIRKDARKLLNLIKIAEKNYFHYSSAPHETLKPSEKPNAYSAEGRRAAEGANVPKVWLYEENAPVEKWFKNAKYEHYVDIRGKKLANLGVKEVRDEVNNYMETHWDELLDEWKKNNPGKRVPNGFADWAFERSLQKLGYDGAYEPSRGVAYIFSEVKAKPVETYGRIDKAGQAYNRSKDMPLQLSYEATPSSTKGKELFDIINNADWETKKKFYDDLNSLLVDKDGELIPAKILGYKTKNNAKEAFVGSYEGNINPSSQVLIGVKKEPRNGIMMVSDEDRKNIEEIGKAINTILNQDAVGWHSIHPTAEHYNGVFVKKRITPDEAEAIEKYIKSQTGHDVDIIDGPNGFKIIDWDGWDAPVNEESAKKARKFIDDVIGALNKKYGDDVEYVKFYADSGLIEGRLDEGEQGLVEGIGKRTRGRERDRAYILRKWAQKKSKEAERIRQKWLKELAKQQGKANVNVATVGAMMGFEKGDDGKWHYNVEKGVLGALGAMLAKKALTDKQLLKLYKSVGEKLHDKLLESPLSPVKNIVDSSHYYLKSYDILKKYAGQRFTRDQFMSMLKKAGVKEDEIKYMIEPLIEGESKIKVDDVLPVLKKPFDVETYVHISYKDYKVPEASGYFEKVAAAASKSAFNFSDNAKDVLSKYKDIKRLFTFNYTPDAIINAYKKAPEAFAKHDDAMEVVREALLRKALNGAIFRSTHYPEKNIMYHIRGGVNRVDAGLKREYKATLSKVKYLKGALSDVIDDNDAISIVIGIAGLPDEAYEAFMNAAKKAGANRLIKNVEISRQLLEKLDKRPELVNKLVKDTRLAKMLVEKPSDFLYKLGKDRGRLLMVMASKDKQAAKDITDALSKMDIKTKYIVDEFQSDWHNEGAKKGFIDYEELDKLREKLGIDDVKEEIDKARNEAKKYYVAAKKAETDEEYDKNYVLSRAYEAKMNLLKAIDLASSSHYAAKNRAEGAMNIANDVITDAKMIGNKKAIDIVSDVLSDAKTVLEAVSKLPSGPLVKNKWVEKAAKDVFVDAALNNADMIKFARGIVHSKRWSLNNFANKIELIKSGDKYDIVIHENNGAVTRGTGKTIDEISEIIGKDATERLLRNMKNGKSVLEGDKLKTQNVRKINFYDKIILNAFKKIAKKYNAKMYKKGKFWVIELNDKMKKDIINKGLPFFSIPIVLQNVTIYKKGKDDK